MQIEIKLPNKISKMKTTLLSWLNFQLQVEVPKRDMKGNMQLVIVDLEEGLVDRVRRVRCRLGKK